MSKKVVIVVLLPAALLAAEIAWGGFGLHRFGKSSTSSLTADAPQKLPTEAALKIQGCDAYIGPKSGALLEPLVLPDAPIEELRRIYGRESKYDKTIEEWEWKTAAFNLQRWSVANEDKAKSIGIEVNPGHIVATPDGIELGTDTFAILLQKMKARGVTVTEHMGVQTEHGFSLHLFRQPATRNTGANTPGI